MRFQPKEDSELYSLLEKGTYDFEVVTARDTVSKKGNEMIELTLKVFGPDKEHTLPDWIVDGAKLKRFCQAIGHPYESGELPADVLEGKSGKCTIGIEQSEQYGDRNKVTGYKPSERASAASESPGRLITEGVPSTQTKAAAQRAASSDADDTPF